MRFWINFLNLGWCFLPKILQIALLSGFSASWFNTTVPGGFLGNRNVGDQATPLFLHSSKTASCRDDATKSKFGFMHTLKERLPKSNLACRGVKKIQSNNTIRRCWQFANQKWMTMWLYPIWNKTCCSPDIQAVSRFSEWFKCTLEWYLRHPGCKRLQLDPESTMRILHVYGSVHHQS
jgi:hypothetical protein